MGHSSLLGTDPAPAEPAGRDNQALGPGDTSDSGSDVAGLGSAPLDADPVLPVDVAMRDDAPHSLRALDMLTGNATDAAGTGERRSAVSDAGPEAADIGVDRIVDPLAEAADDETLSDDEDPDLAFIDRAQDLGPEDDEPADVDETLGPDERPEEGRALEEGEEGAFVDEDDGIPKGEGTPRRVRAHRSPVPTPEHPNPEPDTPAPVPDDDDAQPPDGERENREHHPVRAARGR